MDSEFDFISLCNFYMQNGITGFVMCNVNLCKCPYKTGLILTFSTKTTNHCIERKKMKERQIKLTNIRLPLFLKKSVKHKMFHTKPS